MDELDPLERESQAFGKILMHFQHDAIDFSVIQVWLLFSFRHLIAET